MGNECNNGKRIGGSPLTLSGNEVGDACQVGLASWNAADMAAQQIRNDTHGLKPLIYCMGYEGNGGDDPYLMVRLANVPSYKTTAGVTITNTVYNSTKTSGAYLQITQLSDIQPGFQSVLAEILRLAL